MKPKPNNPDMNFGFYAAIPRILRTEYKAVSPLQKWIYVCLKDLCGEDGTCYRTIRTLAQEIGLSVGMTSETIRVLHDNGLIHAEKKKRHTGGKEVWHISIVDIWQKNGQAHSTKRSQHEQSTPQTGIQEENVHNMNKNAPDCSQHEQECSPGETEEESLSSISNEERRDTTPAQSSGSTEKPQVDLTHSSVRVEPKPITIEAHVDLAFAWLNRVRREESKDSKASYVAHETNKKRLKDLIIACRNTSNEINESNVRTAWSAMWNAGKWQDGKSWQDPGMLTIEAFCKHYDSYLDRGRASAKKKRQGSRGVSGLGKWVPPGSMRVAITQ